MLTYMRRLVDERTSLTEQMTRISETAASEERDMTETERTSVTNMQARCLALDEQISTSQNQVESSRAYATLLDRMGANEEPVERRGPTSTFERATSSFGRSFVESEAFTEYRGRGVGAPFEIADMLETRALIHSTDLNIQPFRWGGPPEPSITSPLLNAVAHVPVSSGVVEWVETGPDPVAAVVPEGQAKPEAAITLTPKSSTLDTLAHWVQITRQALEDAAYIQGLIETKLRRGLMLKAEQDLAAAIAGSATIPAATADNLLQAIRVGIATVQSAGFGPDVVLLNPADWADLDIAVMVESVDGPVRKSSFWGLTPIASNGIAAGTAYVADAKTAFTLFDRGVSNVFLTDSHASLFISNILVILAETRVKSAVTDATAAAKCTATVVP